MTFFFFFCQTTFYLSITELLVSELSVFNQKSSIIDQLNSDTQMAFFFFCQTTLSLSITTFILKLLLYCSIKCRTELLFADIPCPYHNKKQHEQINKFISSVRHTKLKNKRRRKDSSVLLMKKKVK